MTNKLVAIFFLIPLILIVEKVPTFGQQSTQFYGVSLTLNECNHAGGLVTCYLTITSNGEDRSIGGNKSWIIIDGSGQEFGIKNVRYGNKDSYAIKLVADLPTPMVITADFSGSNTISKLGMAISVGHEWQLVHFRNIAVQNLSPGPASGKPFTESHGFTLVLHRCDSLRDGTLTCKFNITSNGIDRIISAWAMSSEIQGRLVDSLGNQYSLKKLLIGNQAGRVQLSAGISKPLSVTVNGFSGEADAIALIDIGLETHSGIVFKLGFRNVPVNADPIWTPTEEPIPVAPSQVKRVDPVPNLPEEEPKKPFVETDGYTIRFDNCSKSKGSLLCTFNVTSNGADRHIVSKSSSSRIVDNLGNEYGYPTFSFSNQGSSINLVADVQTKFVVSVSGFSEDALSIALIDIVIGPDSWPGNLSHVYFRNLPLKAPSLPAQTSNSSHELSISKYDQITIGMSRSNVESLLGSKGIEISRSKGGGITFAVVKWVGKNYRSIILSFKADKVMTKAQVGLEK